MRLQTAADAAKPARAKLLAMALDEQNDDVLGLSPKETESILDFVNHKVIEQTDDYDDYDDYDKNDQPQTSDREPGPPAKTPDFKSMLFPAVLDTGPSAEELIRVALQEKNNKKSFKDHAHFLQVFKPFALKTLATDIEKFRQLYDYEHFINKIARTQGWKAANEYHWDYWAKISDGSITLSQGPYDGLLLRELDYKYPVLSTRSSKPARQPSSFKSQQAPRKPMPTLFCKTHGKCKHSTQECKNPDSGHGSN